LLIRQPCHLQGLHEFLARHSYHPPTMFFVKVQLDSLYT
jgi:hypothetical protein